MAVDVCSASEAFISPRISFSYDLNNQLSDIAAKTTTVITTTTAFDFCITSNFVQQITSADELFSDGKILPTQLKNPENFRPKSKTTVLENADSNIQKKPLKELLSYTEGDADEEQEKSSVKSFWKFTRSASLNCDNGRGPKGLFRSLSLKRLSRSNSTESTLNPRKNVDPKVMEKSNEPIMLQRCSSSIQTPLIYHNYNGSNSRRRPVLKKNSGGGYGGGIKINPILNIPPAYNINLFGFGSLLCKGKTKKKTK